MASLSELVAAAQATRQAQDTGSPLANSLQSGLTGAFAGMQARRQMINDQLDRYVKLLDIQQKTAEIAKARQDMQISGNMAKATGALPMDPAEAMTARGVANDSLGGGGAPPAMNDTAGKLSSFMRDNHLAEFKLNDGKPEFVYKPNRVRAENPAQVATRQEKIMGLATQAAQREWNATQRAKAVDPTQTNFGTPTNDVVHKYIPAMTAYVDGDTSTFNNEMDRLQDPWNTKNPGRPVDLSLPAAPDNGGAQ